MRLFQNMIKAIYKFDQYVDFINTKAVYCILYIFVLSVLLTAANTNNMFYRYYINMGGAEKVIDKFVPEFTLTDEKELQASEKVIKSVTVNAGGSRESIIDYIFDTSAKNIKLTPQWLKEAYNYDTSGNQLLIYVTAKKTYFIYPGLLNKYGNVGKYTSFSNYAVMRDLDISEKEDIYKYKGFVDMIFYTRIFAVFVSIFVSVLIAVFYFTIMIVLTLRMFQNKRLKFLDSFKLSTFAITPVVMFYVAMEIIRYIIVCVDVSGRFIFRIPHFLLPIIFAMYIIAVFKVGKIPMQDMNENSDKI